MSDEGRFLAEPMIPDDAALGFRSGVHPLDDFFARHAIGNAERGIGRVFVWRRPADDDSLPPILGFYTLSMAELTREQATATTTGAPLPRYARFPAALLGRFAIDQRAQGRGFGERLLGDALHRVLAAGQSIGCLGVVVDAKDERAASFYARYGFVSIADEATPRRMFIPLATTRTADDEP